MSVTNGNTDARTYNMETVDLIEDLKYKAAGVGWLLLTMSKVEDVPENGRQEALDLLGTVLYDAARSLMVAEGTWRVGSDERALRELLEQVQNDAGGGSSQKDSMRDA